jgi:hypothetical protein
MPSYCCSNFPAVQQAGRTDGGTLNVGILAESTTREKRIWRSSWRERGACFFRSEKRAGFLTAPIPLQVRAPTQEGAPSPAAHFLTAQFAGCKVADCAGPLSQTNFNTRATVRI